MVEVFDNGIQFAALLVCFILSARMMVRIRTMTWTHMTLFYGSFMAGLLYWLLYLLLRGETPHFIVSEIAWYASYMFLYILLRTIAGEKSKDKRILLPVIVFTVSMCGFYMQWGDYLSNLLAAFLMTLLLYQSVRGVITARKDESGHSYTLLYRLSLLFCILEYTLWTLSCFWMGDGISNPYFWADFLLTVCMVCMYPAADRIAT